MTLRENFDKLSNEELLHKIATQALTSEAEEIAREVLVTRGIVAPAETQELIAEPKQPMLTRAKVMLISCTRGEASLRTAYWSLGWMLFAIAVLSLVGYSFTLQTFFSNIFATVLFAVLVVGSPFHAYCVWKCKKNTSSAIWEHLAGMYAGLQLLFWCVLIPFAMIGSLLQ